MATEGWKRLEYQTTGYLNLNSSVITATISWASPWKAKWFQMHREHCFMLKSSSFKSILIGDSLIAGLNQYCKIWNNFFKPIEALNCDIGGDKVKCFMVSTEFTHFFFLEKCCHFVWYQQFTPGFSRGYSW